jgi:arylsulfatase
MLPRVLVPRLTLHVGDQQAGQGRIKTQPGKFSIAGEGLNIGKDSGEPVTRRLPRASPRVRLRFPRTSEFR